MPFGWANGGFMCQAASSEGLSCKPGRAMCGLLHRSCRQAVMPLTVNGMVLFNGRSSLDADGEGWSMVA